ncbi:MAG: hypothetical protein Q7T03_07775 [Deltaproteobacteria bacterium]|nr:hypothetical protein [Deltaproteobacteria bacterium]
MSQETHPQEPTHQITIINPKPVKAPSLWINLLVLVLLFGMILGAQKLSQTWLSKSPPPEDMEKQIVMEDLENEQPIAEAEKVEMLPPAEAIAEIPPSEEIAPELAKTAVTEVAIQQPEIKVKKQARAKTKNRTPNIEYRASNNRPDIYTNSGPHDLDRRENQKRGVTRAVTPTASPQATATAPLNERDQFIPFE